MFLRFLRAVLFVAGSARVACEREQRQFNEPTPSAPVRSYV